jgi:hypothetical protein
MAGMKVCRYFTLFSFYFNRDVMFLAASPRSRVSMPTATSVYHVWI